MYDYYERRWITVMVPVKVSHYVNIGIISSYEPITEKQVDDSLRQCNRHRAYVVSIPNGEDRFGVYLDLHKEELYELMYTLKEHAQDESMHILFDRIKNAAKDVIEL